MSIQQLSQSKDVKEVLSGNKLVVIDFMAKWCGPCKTIAPKINKLAEMFPAIKFIKVDVDQIESAFVESENVSAMPTFKFYSNGEVVDALTVVGADLNKVRANIQHLSS